MATLVNGCPDIAASYPAPKGSRSLRQQLLSSAAWSLTGAVISRSLNFAAWVVCARLLGKTAFGALSMIQSTVGMFGVLAGMGLGLTATKYVAELHHRDKERTGRVLGLCFISTLLCGGAVSLGVFLWAGTLARHILADFSLGTPLAIGAGLVCLNAMNGYQTGALAGLEAFRTIARVAFWTGMLSFPIIFTCVWVGGLNGAVVGLVISLVSSYFINRGALAVECAKAGIKPRVWGSSSELAILWQFSLPALLTSVLVSPAMWLCNTWLIHRTGGFAELGVYGAADRFRMAMLFIPASVFSTIVPMLCRLHGENDRKGLRTVLRTNLLLNVTIISLPAMGVALGARPLMRMFGAEYVEGSAILAVLALSAVPEALNTILGQPLIASAMWVRFCFDVLLVSTLLLVAKMLIPPYGGLGLAVAYATAFALTSGALGIFVRSQMNAGRIS